MSKAKRLLQTVTVYWTQTSDCYHVARDCPLLANASASDRAVQEGTMAEKAGAMAKERCKECMPL